VVALIQELHRQAELPLNLSVDAFIFRSHTSENEPKSEMKFPRLLTPLNTRSYFLFGARGTGKTALIKRLFQDRDVIWIDLLEAKEERRFNANPDMLLQLVKANDIQIIIDEVQRVPALLNTAHKLIEEKQTKFVLTGSSARKLRHGGANLLAGRALVYYLYPLTHIELGDKFDLDFILRWGSLPGLFSFDSDNERTLFLDAYVQTYLREEILSEQIVRRVQPFRQFLEVAGQSNGREINYAKIGADVGVTDKTIREYFQILEDTLIGFLLFPYSRSIRKQQKQAPKFYFFDVGIARAISGLTGASFASSAELGIAFEHFIICEIIRLTSYYQKKLKLSFLATHGGLEVDLIIEDPRGFTTLVEIKSTEDVQERHLRHLITLKRDYPEWKALCLSRERREREVDGIRILPWQQGIKEIVGDVV
jgi:predicted AAA+ superfamily ATPase